MKATMIFAMMFLFLGATQIPAFGNDNPPKKINFQGLLTDDNGNPVPGDPVPLWVRLYPQLYPEPPIWEERLVVLPYQGHFSVTLGSNPDNPLDLPFDQPYELGVQVEGEDEMVPRIDLTSAPYALHAVVADSIGGIVIADSLEGHWFMEVANDSTVFAGHSYKIEIPHFRPWTLELWSEWPHYSGVCVIHGCENQWQIAVTSQKYNGDGTSGVAGAEGTESSSSILAFFGESPAMYYVKCPGEATGEHNIILDAASSNLDLYYRLTY